MTTGFKCDIQNIDVKLRGRLKSSKDFVCCKMGDGGSGFLSVFLYIATHKMLNYKIQYF